MLGTAAKGSEPFWSEQNIQGKRIMQRGRTVAASTTHHDKRYFIERNTGKTYPLGLAQ